MDERQSQKISDGNVPTRINEPWDHVSRKRIHENSYPTTVSLATFLVKVTQGKPNQIMMLTDSFCDKLLHGSTKGACRISTIKAKIRDVLLRWCTSCTWTNTNLLNVWAQITFWQKYLPNNCVADNDGFTIFVENTCSVFVFAESENAFWNLFPCTKAFLQMHTRVTRWSHISRSKLFSQVAVDTKLWSWLQLQLKGLIHQWHQRFSAVEILCYSSLCVDQQCHKTLSCNLRNPHRISGEGSFQVFKNLLQDRPLHVYFSWASSDTGIALYLRTKHRKLTNGLLLRPFLGRLDGEKCPNKNAFCLAPNDEGVRTANEALSNTESSLGDGGKLTIQHVKHGKCVKQLCCRCCTPSKENCRSEIFRILLHDLDDEERESWICVRSYEWRMWGRKESEEWTCHKEKEPGE